MSYYCSTTPEKSFPLESGTIYDFNERLLQQDKDSFHLLPSFINKFGADFTHWISEKSSPLAGRLICLLHIPVLVKAIKFILKIITYALKAVAFFILTILSLLYLVFGGFAVKNTITLSKRIGSHFLKTLANLLIFTIIKDSIEFIWKELYTSQFKTWV